MTPERKRNMRRLLNDPDVHFEGPPGDVSGRPGGNMAWTLCGTENTGLPFTRKPVTCDLCLALHRWVHQHRREATDL